MLTPGITLSVSLSRDTRTGKALHMKNNKLVSVSAVIALAVGTTLAVAPVANAAARVATIAYQGPLTG